MKIRQIRNATLVIEYGGKKFLIDPWLQDKGNGAIVPSPDPEKNKVSNPITELPCSVDEILDGIDACILTHMHLDHFSADYLPKDMLFIVKDSKDETKLHQMGFQNTRSFVNCKMLFDGVELCKTNAKHGANAIGSIMMGKVCGIIFVHDLEQMLYLAGDTVYYSEVEKVLRDKKPDVVI